jgi:hypothetical protein
VKRVGIRIRRKAVAILVSLACDCAGGECLIVVRRIWGPDRPPASVRARKAALQFSSVRFRPGCSLSFPHG